MIRIVPICFVAALAMMFATSGALAGSIQSSNFDAETVGTWSVPTVDEPTWSQAPRSDEPITISTAQAHSGPNSILPQRSSGDMGGSRPLWDIDLGGSINVIEFWYRPDSVTDSTSWYFYGADNAAGSPILWGYINSPQTSSNGNLVMQTDNGRMSITDLAADRWLHFQLRFDFATNTGTLTELVSGRSVSGPFCAKTSTVQSLMLYHSVGATIYFDDFATMPEPLSLTQRTLADSLSGIEGLLRAAGQVRLAAAQERRDCVAYRRLLEQATADADAALAVRLRTAARWAVQTGVALRARIIKHMEKMPPVTLPASDDWFYTMRPCESGHFGGTRPPAEGALDLFLEGFNTYITLKGGAQFTWNAPDRPVVIQVLSPPNKELFSDITDMCHKLGIRVIMHTTSSWVDRRVLDLHPSWSAMDVRGRPAALENNGTLRAIAFMCFNNPDWRERFFNNVLSFARDTQPDGFMPDEIHWFPDESACGCDICRTRLKKETGFDIPDPDDPNVWRNWASPQWRAWIDSRRRWLSEFVRAFHDNVIVPLGAPRLLMTCATGASKPWRWESGQNEVDFARNGINAHFFEAENSPDHSTKRYAYAVYWPKYYRELKLLTAISRRFGGPAVAFTYPETGHTEDSEQFFIWALAKSLGSRHYDYFPLGPSGIINWERRHADVFTDNHSFADIGIVYSPTTKFLYRAREHSGRGKRHEGRMDSHLWDYSWEFCGWCEALAENHVPFDVLLEDDLNRSILARYSLIILPNVALMKDAWAQAIRDYVTDGGRLIATCETSLFDETGELRDGFALADVFGMKASETAGPQSKTVDYGSGKCRYIREEVGMGYRFPGDYTKSNVFIDKRANHCGQLLLGAVADLHEQPSPWEIRHAPKGVIANAFRQPGRVVVHLLNALGGIRESGDKITLLQRESYPSIADYNGGKDIEIILASQSATSATLYSPDRDASCKLPVTSLAGTTVIRVAPSLLDRYSVIAIDLE